MDASDYKLLATIVETGSLSAAARKLTTSPAMVSKRLAGLEARLGIRLVNRTTRKLSLTAPGERFHQDVLQILRLAEEAENRLSGVRDQPSGLLRVSAPTSFGRLHIAPKLKRFLDEHPRVALEFDLTDQQVDLYAGTTDLVVRITSHVPASAQAHRLAPNRRVLCASPSYLDSCGRPEDIRALHKHRLLAADGQMPWQLSNGRRLVSVERASQVRTNSSEVVRELVLSGAGIAFRSLWDVHTELRAGDLIPLLVEWGAPADLSVYAIHPRAPTITAGASAFIAFLRGAIDPAQWDVPLARR